MGVLHQHRLQRRPSLNDVQIKKLEMMCNKQDCDKKRIGETGHSSQVSFSSINKSIVKKINHDDVWQKNNQ